MAQPVITINMVSGISGNILHYFNLIMSWFLNIENGNRCK